MSDWGLHEAWVSNGGDIWGEARRRDELGEGGARLRLVVASESGYASDVAIEPIRAAWKFAIQRLPPGTVAKRVGWNALEATLGGSREVLLEQTSTLLGDLRAQAALEGALVQATLTRLYLGEIERTLHCDPGYDLRELKGDYLVWVEPYSGEDWKESRRYPTTSVHWR